MKKINNLTQTLASAMLSPNRAADTALRDLAGPKGWQRRMPSIALWRGLLSRTPGW
jgi:hypothetical protein